MIRYIRSLDGLRGVAVGAVLLYHGTFGHFRGGFLGVDIFFVLSGFLITSLLQSELQSRERVDWARFYLRRAGRLLPGLIVLLVASAALWRRLPGDVPFRMTLAPTLLYYSNWVMAYHGWFGPIAHVWSLSIEEQFYMIWPVCFVFMWRRNRSLFDLGSLIVVFATARAVLYAYGSPLGGYLSTLARADELLVGALLARAGAMAPASAGRLFSIVTPLLLLVCFGVVDYHDAWLYYGGFTILSVFIAGMILHLTTEGSASLVKRTLESRPLVFVGKISYGIYLYHLPIFKLLEPLGRPHSIVSRALVLGLQLAVTLVVSWISYRLIEAPVLQWVRDLSRRRSARAFPATARQSL